MSSFSISFKALKSDLASALSVKGYESDGNITKTDFANYVLNDMQNEIADAIAARDAAAIDLPGLGKLPIGEEYEDASKAVKELQARQAVFAKMLTVEGTGTGAKSMFDILAAKDGKAGLSVSDLKALDAVGGTGGDGTAAKLTNEDFKSVFGTTTNKVEDSVIATFDDKLKSEDREAVVDLDPDEIEDENESGFSLTKLLPKLLTGQLGVADLLPMLLGDEDSDDPLMKLLPALLGGGGNTNPLALLLPILLGNDDDSSSSSSNDSLKDLLPILLLTMTQQQPAAPAPAPTPMPYNPWGSGVGGTGYGTNPFGTSGLGFGI